MLDVICLYAKGQKIDDCAKIKTSGLPLWTKNVIPIPITTEETAIGKSDKVLISVDFFLEVMQDKNIAAVTEIPAEEKTVINVLKNASQKDLRKNNFWKFFSVKPFFVNAEIKILKNGAIKNAKIKSQNKIKKIFSVPIIFFWGIFGRKHPIYRRFSAKGQSTLEKIFRPV